MHHSFTEGVEAYATGNDYHMFERIIRPDGEVRYLVSNGQVAWTQPVPVGPSAPALSR